MISSRPAILSVILGVLAGSCGSSIPQDIDHRDANVADSTSQDDPDGGSPGPDVLPNPDGLRPGIVTCEQQPSTEEACDPLPDGYSCRPGSCVGGCLPECRCIDGRWRCSVICRDHFSVEPIECGMPPICRDACVLVPVLPDGGFGPADGPITTGYRYPLYFTPTDMTTLWGDQALMIRIGSGPVLSDTRLAELTSKLTLRTWPELETVPASVSVEATLDASVPMQRVNIKPQSELPDRWYVLHVSVLPFWATATTHVAPDGAYVARFRVGSEPHVATVTFAGGSSKRRLYIGLSESVVASVSPSQLTQVRHLGQAVTCTDVGWVAGAATSKLSFDCLTITELPDEIAIGAGLVSTTGVELAPIVVKKTDLTLGSCGTSCETGMIN